MTMEQRDGWIWMDGDFVPWRDAKVHVLTHTLHYGLGVFEGVRAYRSARGTAIFRLRDHTRRLFDSAAIFGMKLPFNFDQIIAAQVETVRRNKLEAGYLRPMAFYGADGMGLRADNLRVHMLVAAWPWGAYLGDDAIKDGIRVKVASFARHHPNAAMSKAKACGQYIASIMALAEARACDCDEALMLDVAGYVCEGSGENVFVVRDGVVATPSLDAALDGITRRTVMRLAQDLGMPVEERRITRDELYIADEVFLTGTAAEVTPVRSIDGRIIGKGARGPLTERLQQAYFKAVHGEAGDPEWLHFI